MEKVQRRFRVERKEKFALMHHSALNPNGRSGPGHRQKAVTFGRIRVLIGTGSTNQQVTIPLCHRATAARRHRAQSTGHSPQHYRHQQHEQDIALTATGKSEVLSQTVNCTCLPTVRYLSDDDQRNHLKVAQDISEACRFQQGSQQRPSSNR